MNKPVDCTISGPRRLAAGAQSCGSSVSSTTHAAGLLCLWNAADGPLLRMQAAIYIPCCGQDRSATPGRREDAPHATSRCNRACSPGDMCCCRCSRCSNAGAPHSSSKYRHSSSTCACKCTSGITAAAAATPAAHLTACCTCCFKGQSFPHEEVEGQECSSSSSSQGPRWEGAPVWQQHVSPGLCVEPAQRQQSCCSWHSSSSSSSRRRCHACRHACSCEAGGRCGAQD